MKLTRRLRSITNVEDSSYRLMPACSTCGSAWLATQFNTEEAGLPPLASHSVWAS
jgi:hypothetical protein